MRLASRLLAVVVLCACAGSTAGGSSVQPSTSPATTASSQLIEVLRGGQVALVDLTGRVVAATHVPASPDGNTGLVPVGAGGDRAAYLDTSWVLWALHRDGSIERLAAMPVPYTHLLLSPDGQQWAWAEHHVDPDGFVNSTLHIGSSGRDRVIQSLVSPDRALRPYRWGRTGLVVEHALTGLAQNGPFDAIDGSAELIDPLPNGVNPEMNNLPAFCVFVALAIDGTVACMTQTASEITLTVVQPGGASSSVLLPQPRFNAAGNVSFQAGSAGTLVIGGDTYEPGQANSNHQFATSLIAATGTVVRPFGPDGIAPASGADWVWLDGGSMIGMGWLHDPASDSSVWLISADGTARRITPGQAFGVLS